MKIFIISDDNTRIDQERLFLDIINKFNFEEINYCTIQKEEINRTKYTKINFMNYEKFLLKLKNNKHTFIIYFNYYGNLNNLDFTDYKLIIFGHYVFYKEKRKFNNLSDLKVFDFYKLELSKENIKKLFSGSKIDFISDINYPASIDYYNNRNIKINMVYDIFVPLGGRINYKDLLYLIKLKSDLKFLIGPINHSGINIKKFTKFFNATHNKDNITYFNLTTSDNFSKHILSSKIIFLPINRHLYDLTRISDCLSLGKIIITKKIDCTKHIGNILFYETPDEIDKIVSFNLDNKLYEDKKIISNNIDYYDKNNSIVKLTLNLYKFLTSNNE
ncbi:MAG: hypothetical protein PHN31_02770 [Candidatus Gracilibacteria bacterium]|nr:hypothetical protein [Candidatus Gracilibacteria bacterium]